MSTSIPETNAHAEQSQGAAKKPLDMAAFRARKAPVPKAAANPEEKMMEQPASTEVAPTAPTPSPEVPQSRFAHVATRIWEMISGDVWCRFASTTILLIATTHVLILRLGSATLSRTWQGEWLGLLTLLLMVFVGAMAFIGKFSKRWQPWLRDGHIPAAAVGGFIFLIHTGFRVGGLLGLGMWSHLLVLFASGLFLWHFLGLQALRNDHKKLVKKMDPSPKPSEKAENGGRAIDRGLERWRLVHLLLTYSLAVLVVRHVIVMLQY